MSYNKSIRMHVPNECRSFKYASNECNKPTEYKKEVDIYLHHKSIVADIEKFITDSSIDNIYHELVINDIFNILAIKKVLQVYGQVPIDTWIEHGIKLTKELENQMMQYYEQLMFTLKGKKIDAIINGIIIRMKNNEYCFQGGFGHRVRAYAYNFNFPYQWTVRPEFYDKVKLDSIEKIALRVSKQEFTIDEKPTTQ